MSELRPNRRVLLASLSLANLCLFTVWANLLPAARGSYSYYFAEYATPAIHFPVALLNLAALTALFWFLATRVLATGSERLRSAGEWAMVLLFLALPVNSMRSRFSQLNWDFVQYHLGWWGVRALVAGVVLATAYVLYARRRLVVSATVTLILISTAFVPVTVAQAVIGWASFNLEEAADRPNAPLLPPRPEGAPRVVWITFDELDYVELFEKRAGGIDLPAFDRLAAEAWQATAAYPPAGYTRISMPAMVTGRLLWQSVPQGPATLGVVESKTGELVPWKSLPSVFSLARERGVNTAIAGWCHPYCRVFGDAVTRCHWKGVDPILWQESFVGALADQWLNVADGFPGVFRMREGNNRHAALGVDDYLTVHEHAQRYVSDPAIGMLMAHYPVPHNPIIFNAKAGAFVYDGRGAYTDNLVLADRALAEFRRALEASGLDANTHLIVTSDHWHRHGGANDHRIPFLVKLAGENEPVSYTRAFNGIIVRDLILALLDGKIRSGAELSGWMDENSKLGESPYTIGDTWEQQHLAVFP